MVKPLEKKYIRLKDWEFEFQQRGEQPILLADLFCRAIAARLASEIGIDGQVWDYLFTDSGKAHNNPKQRQIMLRELRRKVKIPGALRTVLRLSVEIPRNFDTFADKIAVALKDKKISNKQLANYWQRMDVEFMKIVPWFWYPYYLSSENMLTDRVKQGLERYRRQIEKISDFDEAFLNLVFPTKKTGFQLEQAALYSLVCLADKKKNFAYSPAFRKAARIYLKKYDWLTTFLLVPLSPMTYEELVRRVASAKKSGFKETFELQKKVNVKNQTLAKKILKFARRDAKLLRDVEKARELGYVLTAGVEEAYKASSRYLDFIRLVAKRIGVKFEGTQYLLSSEIINALEKGKTIPAKIIQEREKGFAMMILNGQQYMAVGIKGHEISQWVDHFFNAVDSSVREFKGQVACKGFSRAKVRIALQPSEAHALKEGEILVCPMTNPDYVPAMKRASAIVTDEGGLLSHAAIMSRELGKPCVIATKIATKVLKSGDFVEVDAEKGIIKIIKQ
jgi:phosphoenolpyruvate synthase/pyruvate phosphate dikinase